MVVLLGTDYADENVIEAKDDDKEVFMGVGTIWYCSKIKFIGLRR
ncbi:hypothetical protein [Algoriphagus antarcticus]|nr:hypothetical protein [Algoriphagus antarcticus]